MSDYLKESVSVKDAVPVVVVSIQTFGDFINFNPHLHIVATDGCFYNDGEFMIGNVPNPSGLKEVFQIEVLEMLKKEGLITDFIIQNMSSWEHSGFNIYCGNAIESENEQGIEKLGRYIVRAPISQERMEYIPDFKSHDGIAKVIYRSKNSRSSKTFDAIEWCAKVVSHIPNKGEQLVRYYGFYSNKSRGQRKKAETDNKIPSLVSTDISKKKFKKNWARLIQKIYNVDPLKCKKCGNKMRIISFIEEEIIIQKILKHLGLWHKNTKKNHDPPKSISVENASDNSPSNYNDCESQVTKYDDEFS